MRFIHICAESPSQMVQRAPSLISRVIVSTCGCTTGNAARCVPPPRYSGEVRKSIDFTTIRDESLFVQGDVQDSSRHQRVQSHAVASFDDC